MKITTYTLLLSLDRFPTTLFVTKATPFITNDLVRVESPQVISEYHYNSFNYSYYIHIISKGFIHVNALWVDRQTDTHISHTKMISRNQAHASRSMPGLKSVNIPRGVKIIQNPQLQG